MRNPGRLLFRSFAEPDFRWFSAAALLVNTAMWMQRIAQDWLAIDITGRGATVGIVTALQFLPTLLISPVAGSLADRFSKRAVLTVTGLVLAATALLLGGMTKTDHATPSILYAFALVLGICAAVDSPARLAYVRSLTDASRLTNAMGLSALIFHGSRVIGPAIAGLLMASFGVAAAFLAVGCCHLLATALLFGIAADGRTAVLAGKTGLLAAAAELRGDPAVMVLMALAAAICAFAMNFQVTLTTMATREFGLGADAFGGLSSLMALGSIIGALIVSSLTRVRFRVVIGAAGLLGFAYLASFLCATPWAFGLSLIPVGLLSNIYMATSSSLFQLRVPAHIQGRSIGLYQASSYMFVPAGAALIGFAADLVSARLPLIVSGLICIVASIGAAAALRTIANRHTDLQPRRGQEPETI